MLDLTPTVLALYDLPVGEDMDGRVIASAFETMPEVNFIPSWDDVPGADGRHPAHTRLDPVAATEAMEQLIALGYIEKPDNNIETYVEKTVSELRFNLLEAFQDANRHAEALEIARDLCRREPDDQRYALKRFLSCQALGHVAEMREIVDDMDGRRRHVWKDALARMKEFRALTKERYEAKKTAAGEPIDEEDCKKEIGFELDPQARPDGPREFLLSLEERTELRAARNRKRYAPAITDLLVAQTLVAEKRFEPALAVLERLKRAVGTGPAILLQSANLLRTLGRFDEAEATYEKALQIDPDNTQALQGICRVALRQRQYERAAHAASESLGRLYFAPMTHYLHGLAKLGMKDHGAAADSFRKALSQNPHFPEAHLRLARVLKFQLGDPDEAAAHLRWYREMRRKPSNKPAAGVNKLTPAVVSRCSSHLSRPLPPLGDAVFIVSGLPRSGTSMLMQMLDAGGMEIVTDERRESDEDNPRGYFELEAVKKMFRERDWLADARGKAVKVVVPLVTHLPPGCDYRVVLIERDYDEILASQAGMIARRGEPIEDSQERRDRLRNEYIRLVAQTRNLLEGRADVKIVSVRHEDVIGNPRAIAELLNHFAGGGLDTARMSMAVDRSLHRNRRRLAV